MSFGRADRPTELPTFGVDLSEIPDGILTPEEYLTGYQYAPMTVTDARIRVQGFDHAALYQPVSTFMTLDGRYIEFSPEFIRYEMAIRTNPAYAGIARYSDRTYPVGLKEAAFRLCT